MKNYPRLATSVALDLLKMKLEILRLKADNYNWQCYTPEEVKEQLEEMLGLIESELGVEE